MKKQSFELAINGEDLKAFGFFEGKVLGSVLKEAQELTIEDPDKNTREILLEFAKKRFKEIGSS